MKYLYCPECTKKGVTLREGSEGLVYVCRYCQWGSFHQWHEDKDKLDALADRNPDEPRIRYRSPSSYYDEN